MFDVNGLAVIVAAIAAFVVGFLWHGPLFGRQWMSLAKITEAQIKEAQAAGMGKTMLIAFVAQLVTAYVIAHFAVLWGAAGIVGALRLAFWSWLGFVVPVLLNPVLWERRSVHLYLFNIVYTFVSFAVIALVVTLWQ